MNRSDDTRNPRQAPELRISGLTKTFDRSTVLRDVDLNIVGGELIGLMGPNGAGKSTMIKILDGVYTATHGEIQVGGERVTSLADRTDVGFIHQDLGLVDELSILENLRLGSVPMRKFGPLLDEKGEFEMALRAMRTVALDLSPDDLVGQLAPGEKTLLAAGRMFARGARILFVDEATSTLPPSEAERVISTLIDVVAEGASVVMVSHKLSEILKATSRVVVLIDGEKVADQQTAGLDRDDLVNLLAQHEIGRAEEEAGAVRQAGTIGESALQLHGAAAQPGQAFDLELRRGEIVGLTGLPGSGLHDVAYLVHGSLAPTHGEVKRAPGTKVAMVPPHRETQGGLTELSVAQNMTIASLGNWSRLSFLELGRERRQVDEMVTRLNVQPPWPDGEFDTLSGGNKQKVIFARVFFQSADVVVLCEPTRGIDVGTRSSLYQEIREMHGSDAAVLVVTSDSEDLFAVCDRVAVVADGDISEFRAVEDLTVDDLEAML
jgi:ribose transport system ATP-binding protein